MDRNSLTILAVLALSVSNLFVGITTQNKMLVLASAGFSMALAVLYIIRDLVKSRQAAAPGPDGAVNPSNPSNERRPFPIWVFIGVLFVGLPAVYTLVQYLAPSTV